MSIDPNNSMPEELGIEPRQQQPKKYKHKVKRDLIKIRALENKALGMSGKQSARLLKVVYQEYQNVKNVSDTDKITPLSGYLENEKVPYTHLFELIKSMGDRAKKPFRDAVTDIGKKILGREPEYYDDFYFFRNKVYSNLDSTFSSIDPIIEVRKILTFMQFDLTKIEFDIESRANKYPSPICFFVQIPNDIRILYKKAHILIFKDVSTSLVMECMQVQ